jgi:hypothetical protein
MTQPKPFVRFLRSVKGHLVSRYGTATKTSNNQLIGARRVRRDIPGRENDLIGDASVEWTDEVIALTPAEAAAFKREYDSAVEDKALLECTEADYLAYVEREDAAAKTAARAVADAESAAKAKAESEQNEPRDEPTEP